MWKEGTAPLGAPSTADKAVAVLATATAFTFQGWNPNSNYRFAIAAARKSSIAGSYVAGNVVAPTSAPDWADISATGDYTSNIGGTPAATVVANAADGKTSFDGTVNYRSTGAPTASISPSGFASVGRDDGSVDFTLTWSYTQGTRKADGFLIWWKTGAGTPTLTDPHFSMAARQTAGALTYAFTLRGLPSNAGLTFGVAAYRRTDNATEIGSIVGSTSSPDWDNVSLGTPNYVGIVWGKEQHNFTIVATGDSAVNESGFGITKDGATLSWPAADVRFTTTSVGTTKSWNAMLYDLGTKAAAYAHSFESTVVSQTVDDGDRMTPVTAAGGSVVTTANGQFGRGVQLSATTGQTAYIRTVAVSTRYQHLKSVDLWINIAAGATGARAIVGLDDFGSLLDNAVLILTSTGRLQGRARDSAGTRWSTTASATDVRDGVWRHVCVQIESDNELHLYVNGVQEGVTASSGTLSDITEHATAGLAVVVGFSNDATSGQFVGTLTFDELIVSSVTLRPEGGFFTVPTVEQADLTLHQLSPNSAVWHFQEYSTDTLYTGATAYWMNGMRGTASLAMVLDTAVTALRAGDAIDNLALLLYTRKNPLTNLSLNGMVDALSYWGATRTLLNGNVQSESAYLLVGKIDRGEGSGLERYAGKIASDPAARAELAFQTQDADIIALSGVGWRPTRVPGVPTNNPTTLGIFNTTVDTGNRLHRLTWAYTQPALTGDNKLADGFVLYYQAADTATPNEHQLKLDIGSRALTFQWSLSAGSVVSYGIATYRNTAKGVEVGPLQQVNTWKRVAADQKVQSAGLEDLVTINPSAAGATALFIDNGGKVRLKTLTATPSKMVFENSSGAEQMEISGAPDPYLTMQPSTDGMGQFYIGYFTKRWGDVLIISLNSIQLNVPSTAKISLDCNGGPLHLNGLWHTSEYENLNASTTRAGKRIAVRDSNGSLLGYLQLYNA
jgi:hypothetical protein